MGVVSDGAIRGKSPTMDLRKDGLVEKGKRTAAEPGFTVMIELA
jgi:hypothetical protein